MTTEKPATTLDYLAEWLIDAATASDSDVHNLHNIMYQIAEGVYGQTFPGKSVRMFARNYVEWEDSI